MLEACVNRKTGEIIVVKPGGSPWSPAERDGKVLCVVKLDDDGLDLGDLKVLAYPYAEYSKLDLTGERTMTSISRLKVPLAKLAPGAALRRADLVESLEVPRG